MNIVDCGSYCIANINNQLYRYDYTSGYNINTVTEDLVKNQGTAVKPGQVLQMGMVDENQFAELGFDPDDDGLEETPNSAADSKGELDQVDYNNWLVNNGLSGISKLSSESKLEDIQNYYNQIATKLNSIMSSIDSALASKDPDTIDSYMTELTYNMAALEGVSQQSGLGSLVPEGMSNAAWGGMWGGLAAAGVATMAGATGTLFTVAGVSATIPGIGWGIAGVCALTALGIGIYNSYKQGQIDDLKEQMQQTMDDCQAKLEYAQKEIGETVDDVISTVERDIKSIEDGGFSDIKDMNSVFANVNGILIYQANIEKWAGICEKYGVPFNGDEILEKLGSGDEKNKYADEYIEKFAENTKNAIEKSGDVVDDTGSYIASADEINALIAMLYDSELTRNINVTPLKDLIEFIKENNQSDVDNDAGSLVDGMYGDSGSYDFSGYSNAYDTAGETQTGVDGAASDGQYDVDTSKYEEVQKEAQEAAQKDVDEYLENIDISGKTVEELEELYETTSADLEDFSQYKENLDLDLSKFDTVLSNIRKEQQAQVDEYIDSISVSGKSLSELEELHGEVSAQGEAFKKASSEVDTSAFEDVLSNIREEQQSIVDKYSDEISSKVESAGSISQLKRISAEMGQYLDTVSEYSVNTGKLSAINSVVDEKIQAAADEKATNYAIKAVSAKTSDDCITLADVINIEISQFEDTNADTSGLQKVVTDLISRANVLRIEEAKKKAEEDKMNVPAAAPSTTPNVSSSVTPGAADTDSDTDEDGDASNVADGADEAQTPVTIPSYANDGAAAYYPDASGTEDGIPAADGNEPAEDGQVPATGGEDGDDSDNVGNTGVLDGDGALPPAGETGEPSGDGTIPATDETKDNNDETSAPNGEEPSGDPITSAPSGTGEATDVNVNVTVTTEQTEPAGSSGITSIGQADETTPPPAGMGEETGAETVTGEADVKVAGGDISGSEIEQTAEQVLEDGLEEGKSPDEIADLIEIEVEE